MTSTASAQMVGKARRATRARASVTPAPAAMEAPATTTETLSAAPAHLGGAEAPATQVFFHAVRDEKVFILQILCGPMHP